MPFNIVTRRSTARNPGSPVTRTAPCSTVDARATGVATPETEIEDGLFMFG